MRSWMCLTSLIITAFLLVSVTIDAPAGQTTRSVTAGRDWVVRGGTTEVGFDASMGRIVFIRDLSRGEKGAVAISPPDGDLWTLKTRSGTMLHSHEFAMRVERSGDNNLTLIYRVKGGEVSVRVLGGEKGVDLSVKVSGLPEDILEVACPADLQFDPATLKRVLFPSYLGVALKPPFFRAKTEPTSYGSLEEHYPSRGFSDFSRIESEGGSVSYYGVQDAHDTKHLFVPAHWRAAGDAQGGHLQHVWQTFIGQSARGETPLVRLQAGRDAATAIRAYAKENGLDRPLADKMPARLLDLWKRCILIKSNSNTCAEDMAMVERLPAPAIIHIAHYLHGHFDKQLPDHLPPNTDYGTAEQFKQLIDLIHRKGDLFMPYTNHTWWCDDPKGPTFQREGDAPLLRNLDGTLQREQYGPNGGWSVSPYHPAVIAAADRIVEQFTTDYPADILFQDQNGARPMRYDTNPASPTPYAYTQGLIDLAQRASAKLPVSTEDGFDRLVNIESQFCGLTQSLGAIPEHREMRLSQRLADEDWEFFPIAEYIAHDKAFFIHHDLEQGEIDYAGVSWALALGYQLNCSVVPGRLQDAQKLNWLETLDRLQKALGPHTMGVALSSFRYLKGSGEQGVMETTYGDLRIVSNLTDQPYTDGPVTIAPKGFYAHAGTLEAGLLTTFHGQRAAGGAEPILTPIQKK